MQEMMNDTAELIVEDDIGEILPDALPDSEQIEEQEKSELDKLKECCPPRKTQKTQQSVSKREKYTKPSKTLQLQRFRSAIN